MVEYLGADAGQEFKLTATDSEPLPEDVLAGYRLANPPKDVAFNCGDAGTDDQLPLPLKWTRRAKDLSDAGHMEEAFAALQEAKKAADNLPQADIAKRRAELKEQLALAPDNQELIEEDWHQQDLQRMPSIVRGIEGLYYLKAGNVRKAYECFLEAAEYEKKLVEAGKQEKDLLDDPNFVNLVKQHAKGAEIIERLAEDTGKRQAKDAPPAKDDKKETPKATETLDVAAIKKNYEKIDGYLAVAFDPVAAAQAAFSRDSKLTPEMRETFRKAIEKADAEHADILKQAQPTFAAILKIADQKFPNHRTVVLPDREKAAEFLAKAEQKSTADKKLDVALTLVERMEAIIDGDKATLDKKERELDEAFKGNAEAEAQLRKLRESDAVHAKFVQEFSIPLIRLKQAALNLPVMLRGDFADMLEAHVAAKVEEAAEKAKSSDDKDKAAAREILAQNEKDKALIQQLRAKATELEGKAKDSGTEDASLSDRFENASVFGDAKEEKPAFTLFPQEISQKLLEADEDLKTGFKPGTRKKYEEVVAEIDKIWPTLKEQRDALMLQKLRVDQLHGERLADLERQAEEQFKKVAEKDKPKIAEIAIFLKEGMYRSNVTMKDLQEAIDDAAKLDEAWALKMAEYVREHLKVLPRELAEQIKNADAQCIKAAGHYLEAAYGMSRSNERPDKERGRELYHKALMEMGANPLKIADEASKLQHKLLQLSQKDADPAEVAEKAPKLQEDVRKLYRMGAEAVQSIDPIKTASLASKLIHSNNPLEKLEGMRLRSVIQAHMSNPLDCAIYFENLAVADKKPADREVADVFLQVAKRNYEKVTTNELAKSIILDYDPTPEKDLLLRLQLMLSGVEENVELNRQRRAKGQAEQEIDLSKISAAGKAKLAMAMSEKNRNPGLIEHVMPVPLPIELPIDIPTKKGNAAIRFLSGGKMDPQLGKEAEEKQSQARQIALEARMADPDTARAAENRRAGVLAQGVVDIGGDATAMFTGEMARKGTRALATKLKLPGWAGVTTQIVAGLGGAYAGKDSVDCLGSTFWGTQRHTPYENFTRASIAWGSWKAVEGVGTLSDAWAGRSLTVDKIKQYGGQHTVLLGRAAPKSLAGQLSGSEGLALAGSERLGLLGRIQKQADLWQSLEATHLAKSQALAKAANPESIGFFRHPIKWSGRQWDNLKHLDKAWDNWQAKGPLIMRKELVPLKSFGMDPSKAPVQYVERGINGIFGHHTFKRGVQGGVLVGSMEGTQTALWAYEGKENPHTKKPYTYGDAGMAALDGFKTGGAGAVVSPLVLRPLYGVAKVPAWLTTGAMNKVGLPGTATWEAGGLLMKTQPATTLSQQSRLFFGKEYSGILQFNRVNAIWSLQRDADQALKDGTTFWTPPEQKEEKKQDKDKNLKPDTDDIYAPG